MTNRRKKQKYDGILQTCNLLFLVVCLFWTTVIAQVDHDQVINIEPSQTADVKTNIETLTDDTEETLKLEQAQTVELKTYTDELTQPPISEASVIEPTATATETARTEASFDNTLKPSSTEIAASVQGTGQDATIETVGTTQSVNTEQSVELVTEQEKETEALTDKSLYTSASEPMTEEVPKDSKGLPSELSENFEDKIDKDLQSEEVLKTDGHGEPSPPDTSIPQGKESVTPDGKPGAVDLDIDHKQGEKTDEEELTFNEWAQKVLAEEEKEKHAKSEVVATSSTKQRKKKNYALQECGAKILASNPEATNVKSVLNPNRDDYMINPCKVKKWFVIELCEPVQALHVEMASLEMFSSQPKSFKVFLSDRYPTKDWKVAVHQEMKEERAIQSFDAEDAEGYLAKFVRVELLDHYGNEHFCPLTLFRLFGIAMVDYDSDVEADNDEPDSDDDEVLSEEEDNGESSLNLFSSAKDTVLKIVKKVFVVDDIIEEAEKLNKTVENLNQNGSFEANQTVEASSDEMTLPCPPEVGIPGSDELQTSRPEVQYQPTAPDVRDDMTLVRKIEDDEQIETGDQFFLLGGNKKSLHERVEACFSCTNNTEKLSFVHSFPVMQLCIYLKLLLDRFKGQTCPVPVPTVKSEKEQKEHDSRILTSQAFSAQTDSNTFQLKSDTKKTETLVQSDKVLMSSATDGMESKSSDTLTKIYEESSSAKQSDSSPVFSNKIISSVMTDKAPKTSAEILPEHTKVVPESSKAEFQSRETIIPTQSVLMQQSNRHDSIVDTSVVKGTGPVSSVISTSSDQIQPTPTVTVDSKESAKSSTSRESTPPLPESEGRHLDASDSVTLSSEGSQTKDKLLPEPASAVVKVTSEPVPVKPTVSIAMEPPYPEKNEPVEDSQQQQPLNGKLQQGVDSGSPLVNQVFSAAEEKLDDKGTEDGAKKKRLDLVKVPLVPLTKRESAVMRLNNRIKVLEQNVSLSSRFLEELSKRYKKQSEDMMKLLNKTVAKLNNVTLEGEIKDKLHDDAITAMETRVENLTAIVTELTVKLHRLNQQVTDRQMIWTSIEIIVIMIIMIVVFRRSRMPSLEPEIKEASQMRNLPLKSAKPPFRRNSLSGPATPMKSKSDLDPGPSLQRFRSESTLVHAEFPVIEPGETPFFTPQPKDGQKKKKKKKHKHLESRFLIGLKESSSDLGLDNGEHRMLLPGSGFSSAGVLFRGENHEKFETSRQRARQLANEKHLLGGTRTQRSNSSVSCSSSGTTCSVDSAEANVCDKFGIFRGASSKMSAKFRGLNTDSSTTVTYNKKPRVSPSVEKSFIKTHKRQKSLPLNSASRDSVVENVGSIENNISNENLTVEKSHSIQKGLTKTRRAGVRKSLSMTAATRGAKHVESINKGENKCQSFSVGKGITQSRGANVCNRADDFSSTNGFVQFDDVITYTDSTCDDGQNCQKLNHTNIGIGVNGSKSCSSIDPGGATITSQLNGYATNEHQYLNGHSLNDLDAFNDRGMMNGCTLKDEVFDAKRIEIHNIENKDSPSKSGWKKMIWWF